jgi:protein SHQ1
MIYPLIRSFPLAKQCLVDVMNILSQGKRVILQCLLRMRRIFLDEEHRYLLNTLYLNDYCLWIQTHCQTKWLHSLSEAMRQTINNEIDEVRLELFPEQQAWTWKINLHEQSDTDDQSSTDE